MSTTNVANLLAYDCWHLLEGAYLARVAWQGADGIRLVPVNYDVADGAVWFRIDRDSALAREARDQSVVVEIDDVDDESGTAWSVVVVGKVEMFDAADAPDTLGELRVWADGPHTTYVRIEPVELTGRRLWKP
ncbi:pyridoxamine 5'-phosphate oxidase family protein [Nocardioides caricicola]|uniref:Pyridoxamine 5'-phosphate oxidase family protein n=1 Tax=Nocardioides caricicola TaxID=634770 RepID=A0ABW0N4S7_9ACTN